MKPIKKKPSKQKSPTATAIYLAEQGNIEAFVKEHWLTIAAMAWDGYQTHGRGFLLFDAIPPNRRRYFPAPPVAGTQSPEMLALTKALATYDPAKEIMLVFQGDTFSTMHMFLEVQTPPPPEAYAQYHQKPPVTSIAPEDAKELSEIINPYSDLLMGLDKTTCHSVDKLPHPKEKIKQALLRFAATIEDGNVLVDVGQMYAYLGLFLPDEQVATTPQHEWKEIVAKELLTLHNEFVSYVETHNPHHFKL